MRAALTLLLLAAPASAIDFEGGSKLSLSADYTYTDARVTGSSPLSSYLTVGRRFQQNSGMMFTTKTGPVNWETAADGRIADDDRVEVRKGSLKRAYIKAYTDHHELVLGDFLASYTDRTMGRSLKGAQYVWRPKDTTDIFVTAGVDKTSWDHLWMYDPNESLDRKIYGFRAAHRFPWEARLGLNAVWVRDNRGHLDTTTTALNQRVFSADWALPALGNLRIYGESAFSRTDSDIPGVDFNTEAPIVNYTSVRGWDHMAHADFSWKKFKTSNEVERVDPDYATAAGGSSPDLFKVNTQNTLAIVGPWKWVVLNYTYYHNNLTRSLNAVTSTTRMPETGFRYDGPDWRPSFALEGKVRHREVTTSDDARRRRTRSVISNLSDRFGPLALSVDYEYQHEDDSTGISSLRHHILGVGSSFAKEWQSGWKVTQGLTVNLQRDRDNLIPATDQTTLVNGTVIIESPWGVEAASSASRNRVRPALTPSTDRRTFSASLAYNLLKNRENRIEVRYRQNDNRFQLPDLDFKEMIWEVALSARL